MKNSMKNVSPEEINKVIETWFASDLDIGGFYLVKGRKKLLIHFESDVWYEHINNASGSTIKSIRHKGDHRRFIVQEGPDDLFNQVKQYCYKDYTKEELLQLINTLAGQFKFQSVLLSYYVAS